MVMQRFTVEEFNDELLRRGCMYVASHDFGHEWQTSGGLSFLVPHPEEADDRYPDWMLDDLIARLNLPPTPRDN